MKPVQVLLVSTYESGHQPLHLASPAAALLAAGHQVATLDLSVESWDDRAGAALGRAQAVAFSVPMHTAMRLAVTAARAARRCRPDLPVCFYGLYAGLSRQLEAGGLVDRAIAGEYEAGLLAWLDGLAGPDAHPLAGGLPSPAGTPPPDRVRPGSAPPPARLPPSDPYRAAARRLLPPLESYARLERSGAGRPPGADVERVDLVLAGYVEASQGCAHRCRHCPVPVVYDGRTRAVGEEVVLADVAAQVGLGARHLTFGDPDFLNRPHHALRVARAVHSAFPDLTFDCTVKVEHVLRHRHAWAELAGLGCLFVVSAFECVDDATLARLGKGHTTSDSALVVALLREHGIEVRPSFMPFTPWTTLDQVLDLVDFVAAHDLVANVDPVQYAIRLLLPEGSLLLGRPDLTPHLHGYDPEALTWRWRHPDPRVDALQAELAGLAEAAAANGEAPLETYAQVRATVARAAGRPPTVAFPAAPGPAGRRPRLTEPWFC